MGKSSPKLPEKHQPLEPTAPREYTLYLNWYSLLCRLLSERSKQLLFFASTPRFGRVRQVQLSDKSCQTCALPD